MKSSYIKYGFLIIIGLGIYYYAIHRNTIILIKNNSFKYSNVALELYVDHELILNESIEQHLLSHAMGKKLSLYLSNFEEHIIRIKLTDENQQYISTFNTKGRVYISININDDFGNTEDDNIYVRFYSLMEAFNIGII